MRLARFVVVVVVVVVGVLMLLIILLLQEILLLLMLVLPLCLVHRATEGPSWGYQRLVLGAIESCQHLARIAH